MVVIQKPHASGETTASCLPFSHPELSLLFKSMYEFVNILACTVIKQIMLMTLYFFFKFSHFFAACAPVSPPLQALHLNNFPVCTITQFKSCMPENCTLKHCKQHIKFAA